MGSASLRRPGLAMDFPYFLNENNSGFQKPFHRRASIGLAFRACRWPAR